MPRGLANPVATTSPGLATGDAAGVEEVAFDQVRERLGFACVGKRHFDCRASLAQALATLRFADLE